LSTANSLFSLREGRREMERDPGVLAPRMDKLVKYNPKNKRITAYCNPTFNPIKFGREWPRY
jgi:hypothetical protein